MPSCRVGLLSQRPRTIEVRDLDVAELGPEGELVIRTVMCGICGSDLHRFNGSTARETILGQEILGRVAQAPAGLVRRLSTSRIEVRYSSNLAWSCAPSDIRRLAASLWT